MENNCLSFLMIGISPLSSYRPPRLPSLSSAHALYLFSQLPYHSSSASAITSISNRQKSATTARLSNIFLLLSCHRHHWISAISLSDRYITSLTTNSSFTDYPNLCPKMVLTHAPQFQSMRSLMHQNSLLTMTTFSQLFHSSNN